ncbi:MAG: enoyl-CoA hydratase/isomerase family protein [Thermoplasmata archaeon]
MSGSSVARIDVRRAPPVLFLTIQRPEVRNALDRESRLELIAALECFENDPEVRVVVISGAGDKAFSAGADLRMFRDWTPAQALEYTRTSRAALRRIAEYPKPVIAKVRGYALGGGNELAMACDLVYASSDARFGQTEVNVGLMPGAGGTQRLPRMIGPRAALELAFTGRVIDAGEALRRGLVNAVVAPDELDATVDRAAKELAAKSPAVLAHIKDAVRRSFELPLSEGLDYEARLFARCFGTDDLREGIDAFLEKRPPRFGGP